MEMTIANDNVKSMFREVEGTINDKSFVYFIDYGDQNQFVEGDNLTKKETSFILRELS